MNTNDIIDRLVKTKKLVLMGKNGVGKTYQLKEIEKNINNRNFEKGTEDIAVKPIYIGYDLDKEFNEIIYSLLDDAFYSKSPSKHQKLKDIIREGYSNINDFFVKFDKVIASYKYDEIKSTHIIKTIEESVSKSNLDIKYDYDNGRGNDYFLKLKILVELTDLINKQVEEDFQKNKGKLLNQKIVLLIDEPEKYCFPGLIIKLADLLTNSTTEIVCTSHSPIFVNAYIKDFEELFFIKSKENIINFSSVELISFCNNSYKKDLKEKTFKSKKQLFTEKKRFEKYFESILKKEIIECLYNDIVIIVEGATDRQLINFVLNYKSSNFMFSSYIVQANGKDIFPIYLSILKQYKITIFSVFDFDKAKDEIHKIYNDFIMSNSNMFYYFENNIEETFNLENESVKEKVHVGPTNMLITLLDNISEYEEIINDIATKLEMCHSENIVGEDNIKQEIRKIVGELNITDVSIENAEDNNTIDKYLVWRRLVKKNYKQYKDIASNLNFEKEVKLAYHYLRFNKNLTNISYDNFKKHIQYYRKYKIYSNEFIEFIFGVYLFENDKKELANNLLKEEYVLHSNKLNTFLEYADIKKDSEKFVDFVEKKIKAIFKNLDEEFHLEDFKLADLKSYDEIRGQDMKDMLDSYYKEKGLGFLERKEQVDSILDKYDIMVKNVIG